MLQHVAVYHNTFKLAVLVRNMLSELGFHEEGLFFSESVFLQKAKVMYKVSNNIAPEYVTDLFEMKESNSYYFKFTISK